MDAHALLTSQGWRGHGNSLHPTDNSIGLSKPLLVSRRKDNVGIGKKAHRTSDMWWMNAFDSSLKGLDTSKEGQVVQTVTSGGLDMVARGGAKWVGGKGGLYASFVRGECLSGTITPEESENLGTASADNSIGKKRKRDEDEAESESKKERRARRAAKKVLEEEQLLAREKEAKKSETKEERKARRAEKKALKAQEAQVVVDETVAVTEKSETKEERRERRRLKKLATETKEPSTDEASEKTKKKKRRKE
jgi:nucleolar protein TMA23